jgi:hypothetical protein
LKRRVLPWSWAHTFKHSKGEGHILGLRTHLLKEWAWLGEGRTKKEKGLSEGHTQGVGVHHCWSLDKRRAHQREGAHMSKSFTKYLKISSRRAHLQVGKGKGISRQRKTTR